MSVNPLNSVLTDVKTLQNNVSEQASAKPTLLKRAVTSIAFLINAPMILAVGIGLADAKISDILEEEQAVYEVSYQNFITEDRYIYSVDSLITDLSLNNRNMAFIEYDASSPIQSPAAFMNRLEGSCSIYMHQQHDEAILHDLTNTYMGAYKESHNFQMNDELRTLLDSYILAHEAIHCAEHADGRGLFSGLLTSYEVTMDEVEADQGAFQYLRNVMEVEDGRNVESYETLVETVTTSRILNELQVISDVVGLDRIKESLTAIRELQLERGRSVSITEEDIELSGSETFMNDADTFSHFTSMGIINENGSFGGYEFSTNQHIEAVRGLQSLLVSNDGVWNLWTENRTKNFHEQGDQIERISLSLMAIMADSGTPNNIRMLAGNYLSATESLHFSLPHGIEIERTFSSNGDTVIRLTRDGKLHSFNEEFPAMVVVGSDGELRNVLSAQNGRVKQLNSYSSESALNTIAHIESFYIEHDDTPEEDFPIFLANNQ